MNKVLLTNVETAGNDLPATHDTSCRKKYVKPVLVRFRHRHCCMSVVQPSGYFKGSHLVLGEI